MKHFFGKHHNTMPRTKFGQSFHPGARHSNFGRLTRTLCVVAGFLTLACGVVHIGSKLSNHCAPSATVTCFTPFLKWQTSSVLDDVNADFWRTIFTFNTSVVFDLWTPLFSALYALHLHLPVVLGSKEWEGGSWYLCGMLGLFMAFFASFGYAGNLGVITGFVNVFAAGASFVAGSYA